MTVLEGAIPAATLEPFLRPSPSERSGYIPNVVYSCGGVFHGCTLVLPFGVADSFTSLSSCDVGELLATMR